MLIPEAPAASAAKPLPSLVAEPYTHVPMSSAGRFRLPQMLALVAGVVVLTGVPTPTAAGAEPSASELKPRGRVNDFAGVMQPDAIRRLEATLTGLKQATGAEVAVVTVTSVPDGDVKTFAVELFQAWGIGQTGKDNGVLLLASIQDRRVEIEVGYGIEGILPDAKTGRILDAFVIPAFQQGAYGDGLLGGGLAIAQVIAEDAGVALQAVPRIASPTGRGVRRVNPLFQLLFMLLMIPLVIRYPWLIFLFLGRGGYGGGFGGGFGGGGFGGFGGGWSGGGGAGRGW